MRPSSQSAPGAGVALTTLAGFAVIVVFTAAVGSYIGRHSTPERVAVAAPTPAAPPATAAPSMSPAPSSAAPEPTTPPAAATPPKAPTP